MADEIVHFEQDQAQRGWMAWYDHSPTVVAWGETQVSALRELQALRALRMAQVARAVNAGD